MMRTTIIIDDKSAKELLELSHAETITKAIREAIESFIKKQRIKRLMEMRGTIDLKIDLDELRNTEFRKVDFS
ncbi:MAG: type II toxin-antitoxin system VapB family antitoxin [Candidatus Marinimicrobia bacterium]|nr:type II toxin-antitoxin system VapB family antitoxin [Candidatus Neomarinimicrobiota bacterium]